MKISISLIIFLTTSLSLESQIYSGYYRSDHNVNVNQRVSGQVNVNKTVSTIDYGALANANAQRERNRIENQRLAVEQAKYRDEREKNEAIQYSKQALEIAQDPMKAHEFGTYHSWNYSCENRDYKWIKTNGFTYFSSSQTTPHKSLFDNVGAGRLENVSSDGITSEITNYAPTYNYYGYPVVSRQEAIEFENRRKQLFEIYQKLEKPKILNYKKNLVN